jgi:predicted permease
VTETIRQLFHRARALLQRKRLDTELDAEMAAHLDEATEELISRGMAPDQARRQALIRFGGIEQARDQHRDARSLPVLDEVQQDLRYALRTFWRDRGFVFIAIVILTLGIGANIVVFSVVDNILLRPLPFPDSQRLVWIADGSPGAGMSATTYSADAYEDFNNQNRSFDKVSGYFAFFSANNFKLTRNGDTLPVSGISVVHDFLPTLGVQPALGRFFSVDDSRKNSAPVVVLGNAFWKRQFASDTSIVGRPVVLNNHPVTVVGVLPSTFDFGSVFSPGSQIDILVPAILDDMREWGNTLSLVGRLKPGISLPQAQAEANILAPRLHFLLKHPEYGGDYSAHLSQLKEYVTGRLRRSIMVMWAAVALILLIVCVNLANLLSARAGARSKELAMRRALGASRARLLRQMLTESFLLSSVGAVLGLVLALTLITYLTHQSSIALPLLSSLRVDGRVLLWTLLVSLMATVLFGWIPNLTMFAGDLQDALKDSGAGLTQGKKHDRMRSLLVVSEIALACVLLVGAGLLLRSFLHVLDVDLGFQPSRAAAITVDYDDQGSDAKRAAILQNIVEHVKAIPGIESAGVSDNLPLDHNRGWALSAKGQAHRQGELQDAFVYMITPGYLNAMGIRLRDGRDFTWADGADSPRVAVLNRAAASYLWPDQDAVGRIAIVNGKETKVVGVVADVRERNLETQPGWQLYLPASQNGMDGAELVVRTNLPPEMLASSVMSTLRSMNPGQPATRFRAIQQLVDHTVSPRRFFVLLVSFFAVLGLILASLGIYGVISYAVSRQTQEIGIRMALGASAKRVQLAVIGRTLKLAFTGVALGTFASLAVGKMITSMLFATQPSDPATFATTIFLLGVIATVAGYVPARRASRVNPITALRVS